MIKCTLPPFIGVHEINAGRSPCDGCNEDRSICRADRKKIRLMKARKRKRRQNETSKI